MNVASGTNLEPIHDAERFRVVIVGAGLAGSLMAVQLATLGFRVDVYERRPDPRLRGFIGGRSINLALSVRGITALAGVGLADRVLRDAIAMRGRMMHPPSERPELSFQPYSDVPGEHINSVSRGGLNLTLIDAAASRSNVRFFFDHRCVDVDLDSPAVVFANEATNEPTTQPADLVVGADGAFSAVRGALMKSDRFDYSQAYLEHGYKELHIPPARECGVDPAAHDGFAMEPHALHIWPRGSSMMIALPNPDRTFTCTLFWPFEGEHSFASIATGADVAPFFQMHYPDAAPLMPTLERDYRTNPTSSLVTVRCSPWHSPSGRVVLVGDAAHAIVPFFGQGMNAAFEDCRVLAEMLAARRTCGLPPTIRGFFGARKPHADAIADMAIDNFVEMRDKVSSPDFLHRKRVGQALHEMFPGVVTPLYNLVSFSNVPYAEARLIGHETDRLVDRFIDRVPREAAARMTDAAFRDALRASASELLPSAGAVGAHGRRSGGVGRAGEAGA